MKLKREEREMDHDFPDLYSPCRICGGDRETLTVHCCGYRLAESVKGKVAAGELDYMNGKWFNPKEEEKDAKD